MMSNPYLIDKPNNLSPEPGQVKCSYVQSIQHDYTAGRVIETLQQGRHCRLSYNALD